ncbi:MAG: hypothetical protein WAS33_31180 [Candidatus Promineifilaceae bacterium]
MNDTTITYVDSLVPNWFEAQRINSPATNMRLPQAALVPVLTPVEA